MKPQIALITILVDDFPSMLAFYRDVLGFTTESDPANGNYAEFNHAGVRFSLCTRQVMADTTGHPSYKQPRSGQSFELAFPVDSPTEVDTAYAELIEKGATPIQSPADMPWGMRTAFIADPEGNIHEIFAYPPSAE